MSMTDNRITQEELYEMFGDRLSMDVVRILTVDGVGRTPDEVRTMLRALPVPKPPTLVERLRSEAVNWSATCGDLFNEAADEIERLQAQRL